MTTISAKIIADSINEQGNRLTTMELRYPRCIHSEFMTHRQFSRNAASSRAIPVARMIESIEADPFVPLVWGSNKPGMQAGEECNNKVEITEAEFFHQDEANSWFEPIGREEAWKWAMEHAISMAIAFNNAGYHKQIVNRLLEPFMHITVCVSSTEWSNFYALRDHEDAEPHMAQLAREMHEAHTISTPKLLQPGDWHLPYVREHELAECPDDAKSLLARISAARCARTSYVTTDGRSPLLEEDTKLYLRLAGSKPLHASPLEHQATPDQMSRSGWDNRHQHGNFVGWRQFRKMHEGECQ